MHSNILANEFVHNSKLLYKHDSTRMIVILKILYSPDLPWCQTGDKRSRLTLWRMRFHLGRTERNKQSCINTIRQIFINTYHHCINVTLVACEGLFAVTITYIPKLWHKQKYDMKNFSTALLTLAVASQAPEMKVLASGAIEMLITSPVCPRNEVICWLLSISHSALHSTHSL